MSTLGWIKVLSFSLLLPHLCELETDSLADGLNGLCERKVEIQRNQTWQ
jgi:hypothetical protein